MTTQEPLRSSLAANADRTAIAGPGGSVTYGELARSADKVTRYLLDKSPVSQRLIGICLADRSQLITALIGILNARCVFVPLDLSLPAARLAAMLGELHLDAVITSRADRPHPALAGVVPAVCIEDISAEVDATGLEFPACEPDDSLYVYFTSGSTGTPKGIIGRNKSLLQFVQWETGTLGVQAGARFSQLVSPYFDAFLRDIFVPLLAGGTICLPPAEEDLFTAPKLARWIDAEKIEYVHCVPSVFRQINTPAIEPGMFAQLRYILLSGEKIVPEELVNWYAVFGDAIQLVNLYGATETTMIRAWHQLKPADVKLTRIPIGFPIDGTKLLVAREGLKPCGVMVPGDLYIISAFVSKGYLNDAALTAEKFIPFGKDAGGPVFAYKTGDKARVLADGSIDLLGREDRQIKLRGIRIEPDEIEAVLLRSGLVGSALVLHDPGMNQDGGGLVAFVIPKRGNAGLDASLRAYLENWLPAYSIPATFVSLTEFPLLPNGKIDTRALLQNRVIAREKRQPANDTERKLLAIWKEILGDKDLSTDDTFFSCGGSSLGMMRLIARIYKETDIRLSLDEVFNNLTIQKQAALIGQRGRQSGYTIPAASPKPGYELSAAQHRLYYQYELNRDSTAFNLPMVWEITGAVEKGKIEAVFGQLLRRHEILRTSFVFADGRVQQVVHADTDLTLEAMSCGAGEVEAAIAGFIRPFRLDAGGLFRAALLSVEDGRQLLLTDVHHIVCDGQSQMNLLSDFIRLYRGETLAPLPVQYKDYAEWESGMRASSEYIQHREFWLKTFSGMIPVLEWPSVSAEKEGLSAGGEKRLSTDDGGNSVFSIDRSELSPLLSLADEQNLTLFSGLFSAFLLFLARLTGQDDLVLGINTLGRMQEELEGGVGMYAKTLPIRCRVDTALAIKEYVRRTHQGLVEAQGRQLYDLADIVGELNRQRETPVGELIGAMFVYQRFDAGTSGDSAFVPYEFENKTAKYPITLFVNETPDTLVFRWEYAHSHFTDNDTAFLIAEFRRLLRQFCKHVDRTVGACIDSLDIPPTTQAEEAIAFNF
jgi:amino acid adenylation domain-containing protein